MIRTIMTRKAIKLSAILSVGLACAVATWAAYQNFPSGPALSQYVPAGPLLYLEARDFSALLADWNSSAQKKLWVESGNYEVFSRSRLLLRLKGAGDQFATAAGLPPDSAFLSQIAGTQSALALYDIGSLQFLYITRIPSAQSVQTALWQTRSKFEPRSSGGASFYVRRDPESQKEVAFAVSGDYLLLATREDLMAGALQLMAAGTPGVRSGDAAARNVATEGWWAQSIAAAGPAGDLRMVLDLGKIVPSPYFRTYWVQQNITDLKQYSAAISDLFRSPGEYREERVLLRKTGLAGVVAASTAGTTAAADLVRLVPATAGIYEAQANPSANSCFDLLETKLLAPHMGPAPASEVAPQVQLTSGETGSGSDLETRIDLTASPEAATPHEVTALKQLLDKTEILASLRVQTTETDKTGVFIRIHSAIVLTAASDWSEAAVQSALAEFLRSGVTASQLGVSWQQKSGYAQLDGLWPLTTSVRGKYLLVADDSTIVETMLANFNRKPEASPALLLARFNHLHERANFGRFTGSVDRPDTDQQKTPGFERQPQFFSENIAGLSRTLAGVNAENMTMREADGKLLQTMTYEWTQ